TGGLRCEEVSQRRIHARCGVGIVATTIRIAGVGDIPCRVVASRALPLEVLARVAGREVLLRVVPGVGRALAVAAAAGISLAAILANTAVGLAEAVLAEVALAEVALAEVALAEVSGREVAAAGLAMVESALVESALVEAALGEVVLVVVLQEDRGRRARGRRTGEAPLLGEVGRTVGLRVLTGPALGVPGRPGGGVPAAHLRSFPGRGTTSTNAPESTEDPSRGWALPANWGH